MAKRTGNTLDRKLERKLAKAPIKSDFQPEEIIFEDGGWPMPREDFTQGPNYASVGDILLMHDEAERQRYLVESIEGRNKPLKLSLRQLKQLTPHGKKLKASA